MIEALSEANTETIRSLSGEQALNPLLSLRHKLISEFQGWNYSSCSGFFLRTPKNPQAIYLQFPDEIRLDLHRLLTAPQVQVGDEWYSFESPISSLEDLWQITREDLCKYTAYRVKLEAAPRTCDDCRYLQDFENRTCYRHPTVIKPFHPNKNPKELLTEEQWSTLVFMVMRGMVRT